MDRLARHLRTLNAVLWLLIVAGTLDYLVFNHLPREPVFWAMLVLWPVTGAVWYLRKDLARGVPPGAANPGRDDE